jgi:DNA mismatch endonuclease (patch repair protein)
VKCAVCDRSRHGLQCGVDASTCGHPPARHHSAMSRRSPTVKTASFAGLAPASAEASRRAACCSAKRNTKPEVALRRCLFRHGLRFRIGVAALPGRPDIVFTGSRVVVFVDGDFWHGRHLRKRLARLAGGHNASYWIKKIQSNRARDRRTRAALRRLGWQVVRAWETDIRRDVQRVARAILAMVRRSEPVAPLAGQPVARSRAKAA